VGRSFGGRHPWLIGIELQRIEASAIEAQGLEQRARRSPFGERFLGKRQAPRAGLVDFWQASESEMDVRQAFVTSA
jgi:hypothetical protein